MNSKARRHPCDILWAAISRPYEMFYIVNKTTRILRDNKICDRFDYIFEERENIHLHVCILPRYNWMNDVIDNIAKIFKYAKEKLRNDENYKKIKEITDIVKNNFNE